MPSLVARSAYASRMRSNTARSQSTRSILFTATTMWRMPSSRAIVLCRLVCGSSLPSAARVASMSITATSAVDAPVTMLRVYCSWPGASAMMNLRAGVEK
ncbi:hypothetical protein D3C78_1766100 [compost metagenome]